MSIGDLDDAQRTDATAATRVVAYERPSLFVDALRRLVERRAPEFRLRQVDDLEASDTRPDVLLAVSPGDAMTLEPFERLRARYPDVPVVAILQLWNEEMATSLVDLGVTGVILGDCSLEVAIAALRLALAGGSFAPAHLLRLRPSTEPRDCKAGMDRPDVSASVSDGSFTRREKEVLHRLRQGMQNKIIAYELGISESTVKVHLRNVMKKLNASNRTQVAFMLRRLPELQEQD